MNYKRLISLALALGLAAGLFTAPAAAGRFPDVTDPRTASATETLALLGIVSGTGDGTFRPDGLFDRAAFCKMALTAMNRGGEAALQSNRVIFADVTASHWALGYINAAASAPDDATPVLMRGKGNSRFEPDAPITYAEAVAVLMRVLGYTDSDVATAGNWYAGYLTRAAQIGLTDGLNRTGEVPITRAEAAQLFYNLLFTNPKGGAEPYLVAALGGKLLPRTVVLDPHADGGVRTPAGLLKSDHTAFGSDLRGQMATIALDRDGQVIAITPDPDYTTRTVRILQAEARYFTTDGGEQILIDPATPVLQADGSEKTYQQVSTTLNPGATAVLCYDGASNPAFFYLLDGGDAVVSMVATSVSAANPFAAITGSGADFTVLKNGSPASLSDVRRYDVGTYHVDAGILDLSDRRITGVYENAAPSVASPSTIWVMGAAFQVLDCALSDLATFQVGDAITLLLTGEDKVAGAVSAKTLTADAIGVASVTGAENDQQAEVTLTTGTVVRGKVRLSELAAQQMSGKLVTVSSSALGELTIRTLSGGGADGAWNVTSGYIGSRRISPNAAIYERVGNSPLYPVKRSDVTATSIPASKISYVGINAAGQVDLLILEDATGDPFAYGLGVYTPGDVGPGMSFINSTISVEAGEGARAYTLVSGVDFAPYEGVPIGITPDIRTDGTVQRLSAWVALTEAAGVRRSAIRDGYATVNGVKIPLAADIDKHCYNSTTKTWFASLEDALAYAATVTLYYDRAPEQGGKIRMVIAR